MDIEEYFPYFLHHYLPSQLKNITIEEKEGDFFISLLLPSNENAYLYGHRNEQGKLHGDYRILTDEKCLNFNFVNGVVYGESDIIGLNTKENGTSFEYYYYPKSFCRIEKIYNSSTLVSMKYLYFVFPSMYDHINIQQPPSGERFVGGKKVAEFFFFDSDDIPSEESKVESYLTRFYLQPFFKGISKIIFSSHPLLDFFLDSEEECFLEIEYFPNGTVKEVFLKRKEEKIRTLIREDQVEEKILQELCESYKAVNFKFGTFE